MVLHGKRIILFGGFFDTGKETRCAPCPALLVIDSFRGWHPCLTGWYHTASPGTVCRYYNDVWSFDLEDLRWTPLGPKPGQTAPAPRGGCQLALSGDQLFIFGGYSVKKAEQDTGGWVGRVRRACVWLARGLLCLREPGPPSQSSCCYFNTPALPCCRQLHAQEEASG